jgi:hypothetical protein
VNEEDNEAPANDSARTDARLRAGGPRAAVIVGNDAVVAALPSSPAQLARACAAAGFDMVVPPSWGDELVADGYLTRLAGRRDGVVIACACPRVIALLARSPRATQSGCVTLAAPPVAAARYLRLVYGEPLLVTYVGDCPSASDPSIDARFTPAGFFASLHRQGVTLDTTPLSPEPEDASADRWRRHRSMPGGLPTRRLLARAPVDRVLREVDADLVDPAAWATSRSRVLLDLSDAAACACGGNRAQVEDTQPSRNATPILVAPPGLSLRAEPATVRSRGVAHPAHAARAERPPPPTASPPPAQATAPTKSDSAATVPPAPKAAARPGAPPVAAVAGIAHPPAMPRHTRLPRPSAAPATAARGSQAATPATMPRPDRPTAHSAMTLIAIPAVVLAITAALGIAAYAAAANAPSPPAAPRPRSSLTGEAAARDSARDTAVRAPAPTARDSTAATPLPPTSPARSVPQPDSARTRPLSPSGAAAPVPPRRPRAQRAPELVPGWLPQGQKAWTPADTLSTRRPDSSGTGRPRPDTVPRT